MKGGLEKQGWKNLDKKMAFAEFRSKDFWAKSSYNKT